MLNLKLIIKHTFQIISSRKKELLPFFAVFFVVEFLLSIHQFYSTGDGFTVLFFVLGALFMYAGLVGTVMYYYKLHHKDTTLKKAFLAVQRLLVPVIIAVILMAIGTMLGLLLFIIPGFIALSAWALVMPIIVLERTSIKEAFIKSFHRTKGSRYPILYNFFLFTAISVMITFVMGDPTSSLGITLASAVVIAVLNIYYSTSSFVIYDHLTKNSEAV